MYSLSLSLGKRSFSLRFSHALRECGVRCAQTLGERAPVCLKVCTLDLTIIPTVVAVRLCRSFTHFALAHRHNRRVQSVPDTLHWTRQKYSTGIMGKPFCFMAKKYALSIFTQRSRSHRKWVTSVPLKHNILTNRRSSF